MGKVRQQSILSVLMLIGSVLIGYVNKIPVGTEALSPAEIGVMGLLLSAASLFGIIAQTGISPIVFRFFPFFKDDDNKHKGFLSFALVYPILGVTLVGLLLFFCKDFIISSYDLGGEDGGISLQLAKDYYYLIFPLTVILVYFDLLGSYSASLFKSAAPIFFRDVLTKVLLLLCLLARLFNYVEFSTFLLLLTLSYFLQLVGIVLYLMYHRQFKIARKWLPEVSAKAKEMTNFGLFTAFSKGTNYLVAWIDSMMVSTLVGIPAVGVYFIYQYFGLLTTLASRALQPITMPLVAGGFKEENMEKVQDVYRRTAIIQLIGGGLILVGLIVNIDNVVAILPPEYAVGSMVGVIIGVARLFDMSTGVNGMIIVNSKYYRYDFYFMIALTLLSIATNYYFITTMGLTGAAVATAISAFIYNFWKCLFVKWKFNMQPFTSKTFVALAIIVVVVLLGRWMPYMGNLWLDILVRSAAVTVLYAALVLGLNVSSDINQAIKMILKRLKVLS